MGKCNNSMLKRQKGQTGILKEDTEMAEMPSQLRKELRAEESEEKHNSGIFVRKQSKDFD